MSGFERTAGVDPGSVRGFLDDAEGARLHELMLEAGGLGPGLEVGSYCGKSTLWLGAACARRGVSLFAVDHHLGSEEHQPGEAYHDPELYDGARGRIDSFPHLRDTILRAGLQDTVVPVVAASRVAARDWATPLSLVFIDGGHSLEAAETDLACWAGHILTGGMLLIHDIFASPEQGGQAPRLIYERALASGAFEPLEQVGTLGALRRRPS